MSNLFEITSDMMQLVDMLDDPEIELDEQTFLDTWEAVEGEMNLKIESWLKVIKNKEADIKARKELMDELNTKNKRDENAINRMKATLIQVMNYAGKKTAGTEILSATVCGNGGKLPLNWADGVREDPRLLPEEYQVQEVVVKANVDKIREDLDAGIPVQGVEYGERGSYLRIK